MASPAPPCPDATAAPKCRSGHSPTKKAQATLPDHLTEEILLRVPTAADLARASMAGPSLRRVISDHSFLRRLRTLHAPPLLGILSTSFRPAEPPHPSAAAARTLADVDFSCSFLPSREEPWHCCDFRDGRALLRVDPDDSYLVRDVAVCDPLHRRYILLPPVPQDLSDLVYRCDPFLAPASIDHSTDIAADSPFRFRVLCLAKCETQLVLFVFSSSGGHAGQWHHITFHGWSDLVTQTRFSDDAPFSTVFGGRYYVHGCFYWPIPAINKYLMLDIATMEFSSANLPPGPPDRQVAFVEATEGRLGMFALNDNPIYDACNLCYSVFFSTGDDPRQWQKEDVVPLPHGYFYLIFGVAGGYLILHRYPDGSKLPSPDEECFSLNLQTMKLERFCGTGDLQVQLYAGFPPSLSPPTI